MRFIVVLLVALLILGFTTVTTYAEEDECPCGIDTETGECLPCDNLDE